MVTLEDFLTDLYSLFDQKIHCTESTEKPRFFTEKLIELIFASKIKNFHGKIAPKYGPKNLINSPRKIAPKPPLKNRPEKSPLIFLKYQFSRKMI